MHIILTNGWLLGWLAKFMHPAWKAEPISTEIGLHCYIVLRESRMT